MATAGQFAGKVAAITGGTQGLGEAVARLFAARGAAGLAICGRNVEQGERIANELSGAGCPTEFVHADLERMEDGRNFIDSAEASFGRLDILVNCAAGDRPGDDRDHDRRDLGPAVHAQRQVAVLPDPARSR